MSINQAFGVSDNVKTNKLGKVYWSIDFEMNDGLTEKDFREAEQPIIGELLIGDKKIPLTFSECNRIMETLHDAKHTHHQIYKLGLFKK
jgi:hypothetical protein